MLTKCSCCERVLNIRPEVPPQQCVYCHEPFVPAPMPPKRRVQKFILVHNRPYEPTAKSTSVDNQAGTPNKPGVVVLKAVYVLIAAVILFFTAQTSMTFVSQLDWERTEGVVTFSYSGWSEQRYNFTVDGVNYSGVASCPTKGGASPGGSSSYAVCPEEGSIAHVMYDPANPEENHLGSKLNNFGAASAMWFFTAIWVILPLLLKFNVIVFVEDLTREKEKTHYKKS